MFKSFYWQTLQKHTCFPVLDWQAVPSPGCWIWSWQKRSLILEITFAFISLDKLCAWVLVADSEGFNWFNHSVTMWFHRNCVVPVFAHYPTSLITNHEINSVKLCLWIIHVGVCVCLLWKGFYFGIPLLSNLGNFFCSQFVISSCNR